MCVLLLLLCLLLLWLWYQAFWWLVRNLCR